MFDSIKKRFILNKAQAQIDRGRVRGVANSIADLEASVSELSRPGAKDAGGRELGDAERVGLLAEKKDRLDTERALDKQLRKWRLPISFAAPAAIMGYLSPVLVAHGIYEGAGAGSMLPYSWKFALYSGLFKAIEPGWADASLAVGACAVWLFFAWKARHGVRATPSDILSGAASMSRVRQDAQAPWNAGVLGLFLGLAAFGAAAAAYQAQSYKPVLDAIAGLSKIQASAQGSKLAGLLPSQDACAKAAENAVGQSYALAYMEAQGRGDSPDAPSYAGVSSFMPGRVIATDYGIEYAARGTAGNRAVAKSGDVGAGYDIQSEPPSSRGSAWLVDRAGSASPQAGYVFWRNWTLTQEDADLAKALDAKLRRGPGLTEIKILAAQADPSSTAPYGVMSSNGSKSMKEMPGVLGTMRVGIEGRSSVAVPAICQRFMAGDVPSFKFIPAQRAPAVVRTLGQFDHFYKVAP